MFDNSVIYVNRKTGERQIGGKKDLSYFLEDYELTGDQVTVLPLDDATAPELAEVIERTLEGANYHSLVSLPSDFLKKLAPANLTGGQTAQVLRALGEALAAGGLDG